MLWVNGFPLVVGETKTPVKDKTSWLNAALDITETYEAEDARLLRPERALVRDRGQGLPLRAGRRAGRGCGCRGASTDRRADAARPGSRAALSVELLLDAGARCSTSSATYTLYSIDTARRQAAADQGHPALPAGRGGRGDRRARARPDRAPGLVWHHQGSGKTLLMAFAAGKLRRETTDAPTVVIVLDRLDLIEQVDARVHARSASAGLRSPRRSDELRRMLRGGSPWRDRARRSSGSRTPAC